MQISLVIPAHNEAEYIGRCLAAASAQSQPFAEIILVDNNCTDKTIEIARHMQLKNLHVVRENKQGIGHARSAGFDAARSDIIARIDADTILPTDWNKQILADFDQEKPDAITGPAYFYDFPRIVRPAITWLHIRLYFHRTAQMMGSPTLWGSNMAITKAMWQRVKPKITDDDSLVHEDVDLALQIHRAGGNIYFDPKLLVGVKMRQLYRSPRNTIAYFRRRRTTIERSK
jgi:glycosyltransferase involved in cell wall biosynthesis